MRYRFFRHPKTTQERRANQDGYCRARRRPHNLIDAYEDIPRCIQRCWKKYRKTQYRIIEPPKNKKDSSKYGLSMSGRNHFHLEHRRCYLKSKRCKFCWKNRIWARSDRDREKQWLIQEKKWKKETEDFWKEIEAN